MWFTLYSILEEALAAVQTSASVTLFTRHSSLRGEKFWILGPPVPSSSSRNEYSLGGTIALLLQDHRTHPCLPIRAKFGTRDEPHVYSFTLNFNSIGIYYYNIPFITTQMWPILEVSRLVYPSPFADQRHVWRARTCPRSIPYAYGPISSGSAY